MLNEAVGDVYWTGAGGDPGDGIVEMFHGQLDEASEVAIPSVFTKSQSTCRCIVGTIAFGLGLQIPDVRYVIHWGPPKNMLQYWQEVGRGGRDGEPCTAIMYLPRYSTNKTRVSSDLLSMIQERKSSCMRKRVLKEFQIEGISDDDIDSCCGSLECCTACSARQSDTSESAAQQVEESDDDCQYEDWDEDDA